MNLVDPFGMDKIPKVDPSVKGTPEYYVWRANNFVERNPGCQPPSYYMNYGYKYSKRFSEETIHKLSPLGKKWLIEVLNNLQDIMEDRLTTEKADGSIDLELLEDDFMKFAYNSHVEAYWNNLEGHIPLYLLPISDLITIASTPDFKDIINRNGIIQVAEIVSRLISFYESHPTPSFGLNVFIMMYLQSLLNNNLETHDNEQEEALD